MKPFPVFTKADLQPVLIEAFKKHKIQQPAHRSSTPKDKQSGSRTTKDKVKRVVHSSSNLESEDSGDSSDSNDEEQPPIETPPALPKIFWVKPLASRLPTPDLWWGQLIDVSENSDGSQVGEASTLGAKKNCAE